MPPRGRIATHDGSTTASSPPPHARATLGRILDQLRWTVVSLSESWRDVEFGWVARTPSLPLVHSLNQVCVCARASVADALALAEREQQGLPFRHICVSHPRTAAVFANALGGKAGWRIEREVLMALVVPTSRQIDTSSISVLDDDETDLLMRRWAIENHLDSVGNVLDQVSEYSRREGRLWHEHAIGVRDEQGAPVAITKLRSKADVGWVEDVYTVPEARGLGHARTLVTYAAEQGRAAGSDLVFIVADDQDWPKNLYIDIGFRPVGLFWTFHHEKTS